MEIDLHNERLVALASELRAGGGECPFVVRGPHEATIKLAHFSAGSDATYVLVEAAKPATVVIGYAPFVEGTTLIYDVIAAAMQGKARPFVCELDSNHPRVYALLPVQIEIMHVELRGRRLHVEFQDASGERIEAALPFQLTLTSAGGNVRSYYGSTDRNGRFVRKLAASEEILSVTVRSLLTGCEERKELQR